MCNCPSCGWPVYGGVQITIICPRCGHVIECDGTPPDPTAGQPEPPCSHRGDYLGLASCGCGGVYVCNLLKQSSGEPLLCGDRIPIDEFVDFQGTMLNPETYRRCPDCPSNTNHA